MPRRALVIIEDLERLPARREVAQTPALSPSQLAECEWVVEFCQSARGDPRLSAWEEQFLTDLGRRASTPHGMRISERQAAILRELADRVASDPPEAQDVDADPEADDYT